MGCILGFNLYQKQGHIVDMTCPPYAVDDDRTVRFTASVDESNGWWTGLVSDQDQETGETRIRLERWVENGSGYQNPHVWRVRPDFWDAERAAVSTFRRRGGRSPPDNLPIDEYLTPLEYSCIRKDDHRWVAIVRLNRPGKGECTRLYHWNVPDAAVRQKWTVNKSWSRLEELATQFLHS